VQASGGVETVSIPSLGLHWNATPSGAAEAIRRLVVAGLQAEARVEAALRKLQLPTPPLRPLELRAVVERAVAVVVDDRRREACQALIEVRISFGLYGT